MVDYDCGFTVYFYYLMFMCLNKWYITVVTWALVVCLIYTPSALGPAALVLWVYISEPLVPMLQLYITLLALLKSVPTLIASAHSTYILKDAHCDRGILL